MCGIAGIFDTQGRRPIDAPTLNRMTDSMVHRGPDGRGVHLEPGLGLGHRRLSIIDLAGGAQPMHDQQMGTVVAYNGEVYNFRALRAQLQGKGHAFHTDSDTEVLLKAWVEWGPDCVEHFDGMFAFALWDVRKQTLFLARDRLGKKPLYYAQLANELLLFGSELKALAEWPRLDRTQDRQAVASFFAYGYVPDPMSIYKTVRKLPPGHSMLCERGKAPVMRQWWDATINVSDSTPHADQILTDMDAAVKARLVSDVPLGAFLSGGVDSSAIVASMALQSDQPVKTCAIGFDSTEHDETEYAQILAEKYGTDHRQQQVDANAFHLIDELTDIYDEPYGDYSALPTLQLSETMRQSVTVALSGDGGDEVFAGYRRYIWHMREQALRDKMPERLRTSLFDFLGKAYPRLDGAPSFLRARHTFQELGKSDVDAYFMSLSYMDDEERTALFSGDMTQSLRRFEPADILREHWTNAPTEDPLARAQYADLKTWLAGDILVKVDRASMARSLEVRSPLLDHNFVCNELSMAANAKLAGGEKKAIFKKALEGRVPHDLLYRPKQGFSPPLAQWCRGPLVDRLQAAITSPALAECGMLNMDHCQQLLDDHRAGRRDNSRTLWLVLMFYQFLRKEEKIGSTA